MSLVVTITKLANNKVEFNEDGFLNSLEPQLDVYKDRNGRDVTLTRFKNEVIKKIDFNEVTQVTRQDGTVVPISDQDTLYSELRTHFFFSPVEGGSGNHFPLSDLRLVFKEDFVGDGVATTFQLTGAIQNGTFTEGSWSDANIVTSLPGEIVRSDNLKPTYTVVPNILGTRIGVDSISPTGLVTLNGAVRSGIGVSIYYWYTTQDTDTIEDYYREDIVSRMEADNALIDNKIQAVQDELDALEIRVDTLETDVSTIQGQITVIQGQISTLQSQVATLQSDVSTLQSDVAALEADVLALQSDVTQLETDLNNHIADTANPHNTSIENIITAETDTSLVAQPDGLGGVTFNATTVEDFPKIILKSAVSINANTLPDIRVPFTVNSASTMTGWTVDGTGLITFSDTKVLAVRSMHFNFETDNNTRKQIAAQIRTNVFDIDSTLCTSYVRNLATFPATVTIPPTHDFVFMQVVPGSTWEVIAFPLGVYAGTANTVASSCYLEIIEIG